MNKKELEIKLLDLEKKICCIPKSYDNKSLFPQEGKVGMLYIDESNGFTWTWNGSTYIDQEGRTGVYKAFVTQAGLDAPVATILVNTVGAITWSRADSGEYLATLNGAFLSFKTFVLVQTGDNSNIQKIESVRISDDVIAIYCPFGDDGLFNREFIIETYP